MAIKIGDLLMKLGLDTKAFNDEIKKTEQNIQRSFKGMESQLRIAGAAFTAVGVAGLKMAGDARKLNAEIGQTALKLGISTGEMRKMVLQTADVTFSIGSVAKTFELLSRAGVTNTTDMQANAKAFDALADATGSSADVLADLLLPAFKLFGEEIPKTSEELDKFTWLTKNTLVDLGDFGTLLTRMAPYMDTLDMSMEDAIVTLAALSEQGITGTAATLKLRTAITQAASSGQDLNTILGISKEVLDGFKTKMSEATGITDRYAAVANTQFGLVDKIKHSFSELTLQLGSFLQPFEGVLAGMASLGPILLALSTRMGQQVAVFIASRVAMIAHTVAVKAATVAQWALNAAVRANPLGLIAIGVGLVVAAFLGFSHVLDETKRKGGELVAEMKAKAASLTSTLKREIESQRATELNALDARRTAIRRNYDDQIAKIRETYGYEEQAAGGYIELERRKTDAAKQALDKRMTAERDAYNERIGLLEKEYRASLKTLDKETQDKVESVQEQIDAIDSLAREEDRTLRGQSMQKRYIDLIDAIAKEKDLKRREELEEDLAELKAERHRQEVADARQAERVRLQILIETIRADAQARKDSMAETLEATKEHGESVLAHTISMLEAEKLAEDSAFEEKKTRWNNERIEKEKQVGIARDLYLQSIDEEEIALKDSYNKRLDYDALYLEARRRLYEEWANVIASQIEGKIDKEQQRLIDLQQAVTRMLMPEMLVPPTAPPGAGKQVFLEERWQHGGIIKEPTLLSRLSDMRPYAVAGERGPEIVSPAMGGYGTANIYIQMDGQILAEVLGMKLVDIIRLRTGVRI